MTEEEERAELHKQKLGFINAVIDEVRVVDAQYTMCRTAVNNIPREVKDLTERDVKIILSLLPSYIANIVEDKAPKF